MSFITELKRRNVFRVGVAYALIAWVILQAADFFLDVIDAPNWVVQALLGLAVIGLPVVLVFSWVYEMTPEGLKREHEVNRDTSITPQTGRKLDRVIIGFLVLVVAWFAFDEFYLEKREAPAAAPTQVIAEPAADTPAEAATTEADAASVAVLPFVNMSGDPENEYFSDGLTETLLHMLAQLPELQVAARTSSFAFKGKETGITEIAATLGVAHILEGSVQKAGDRVRVTAQLIRADDGFHVWSQNYTRPLEDIFAIQDEIASDVASALDASLLGSVENGMTPLETTDLTAYDYYLRGLEQQAIYSYESTEEAENYFKQALTSDPEFVDARLALIRNYLLKFRTGMIDRDQAEAMAQPLLADVYLNHPDNSLARAYELHLEMWDFSTVSREQRAETIEEMRSLLAVIPTETFIRQEASLGMHFQLDRTQEAIEIVQAGLLIDPLDADQHMQLGAIYQDIGRLDEARTALMRAQELSPEGSPTVIGELSELERAADDLPAALNWLRIYTDLDPQDHEVFALIAIDLAALGLPEEAGPWLAQAQLLSPTAPYTRRAVMEHAYAKGDRERGAQLAKAMIEEQISGRGGAFFSALITYADDLMRQGRSREAYDWLVSLRPEILDYDSVPEDAQGRMMQTYSILLMSGFDTFENRQTAWNRYAAVRDELGWTWKDPDSGAMTNDLLFNGKTEEAIEQYLEHRANVPIAQNLYRHHRYMPDMNRDLYADPRIDAALNDRARQVAEVREEVVAMLQTEEWAR